MSSSGHKSRNSIKLDIGVKTTTAQLHNDLNYTLAENIRHKLEAGEILGEPHDSECKAKAEKTLQDFPEVKAAFDHLAELRKNPEAAEKLAVDYAQSKATQTKAMKGKIQKSSRRQEVSVNDDFFENAMLVAILLNSGNDQQAVDWGKEAAPTFAGFEGGSFGGAGASGDFGMPDFSRSFEQEITTTVYESQVFESQISESRGWGGNDIISVNDSTTGGYNDVFSDPTPSGGGGMGDYRSPYNRPMKWPRSKPSLV